MSKLDEAKELMGLLKFWLGSIVAVFVAISGWIANHYKDDDILLLVGACIVLVLLLLAGFGINRKIKNQLKIIRDLKK